MRPLWIGIIVTTILILAVGSLLVFLIFSAKSPSNGSVASICSELSASSVAKGNSTASPLSSTVSFLIVDADPGVPYEGMNGSAFHGLASWPMIHVFKGQTVTIRIINCAPSEAHGFSISHYFVSGVALRAGQSYTFTFTANTVGSFKIFCDIFCAIHPFMQNGLLIVT
jgi:heme/copper-type cytochrome/quinol oxidase subunit 2